LILEEALLTTHMMRNLLEGSFLKEAVWEDDLLVRSGTH